MKRNEKIISFFIALIFTLFVVGCNHQKTQVHTVILDSTSIDYQSFFNEFHNAELIIDESTNSLKFSGIKTISSELLDELDLVSISNTENELDIQYIFDYCADTNEFYLSVIADTENGEIIDNWFGVPFTTEDGEIDIAFQTDDGIIYLSELKENEVLNNCGWFSKILKKVATVAAIVAVVAIVAAVVVVAAPAVAAAGTVIGTALTTGTLVTSAGVTVAATTGAVASAAIAAGAAAGAAALAGTAFAIASTTAVMATAIAATAFVVDNTLQIVSESVHTAYKELSESIKAIVSQITMARVYYFAYLSKQGLVIDRSVAMNYVEAYAVLLSTALINVEDVGVGALKETLMKYVVTDELKIFIEKIKSNKDIKKGYLGVYTYNESDAAKLAYIAGGFFRGIVRSEIHDYNYGSGYYYHFHDFSHNVHVWYGNPA